MDPLETLVETPSGPGFDLPAGLRALYGGSIGFERPSLFANFVSSLDGVVAVPGKPPSAISDASRADRFVMALLRACASAVVIGAGTLRAEPEHRWTPEFVAPELSDGLAELRVRLGLKPQPQLFVVSASGEIDPGIPVLEHAVVLTTPRGAETARSDNTVVAGQGNMLSGAEIVRAIRARGHDLVLSEAGPQLTRLLCIEGLLDELFLTVSPRVLGGSDDRPRFAGDRDLSSLQASRVELVSVRRQRSQLFLRYRWDRRTA